jgi:hypothetical protein
MMRFLINLLRMKSLYMFRALLARPKEALHKCHLLYCMRVMSVNCTRIGVKLVQPTDITCMQYTKCHLWSISWGWAHNALNMYRPLILNKLNKKCITLVPLYWYTVRHGQQNTILIYCEARSAEHYTDILWGTVSRTLYWYTVRHGQQNTILIYCEARSAEH